MNYEIRQLRAVIAVAELGSFTRAADALALSQPALTVQVRGLEERLGQRLFDRNTRSVSPTRAGRELIPELKRLLTSLDSALSGAQESARMTRGVVRIAVLPSAASGILPDLIAGFRIAHPTIDFVLRDVIASEVVALTQNEEVDLGMTGGRVDGTELSVLLEGADRMHAVFPAGHALDGRTRVSLAAVAAHRLVLMTRATSVRAVVDAAMASENLSPQVAAEATYMSTAVGLVRAGLGVAILPETALEIGALPTLRSAPIDGPSMLRTISVIKRAGRTLPPAAEAFLDQLRGRFKAHDAAH